MIFNPESKNCATPDETNNLKHNTTSCTNKPEIYSNKVTLHDNKQNRDYSTIATTDSKNSSCFILSTAEDGLVDQIKAIPTFRRTVTEKKYHRTFISYEYTRSGKHPDLNPDEIIHDKPSVPIWILAMMAYMCVIVVIVIAMYLYQ